MPHAEASILVLDAMGVVYQVGDDVADLLIPFIREQGGSADDERIETAYREASLGRLTAEEFWQTVDVSSEGEDEYLAGHILSGGLIELLQNARSRFERVYCLSNDLSEWSLKLRRMFQLEPYFDGWFISGDLGLRKPDPQIYQHMLNDLTVEPKQVVFVDDRPKNLHPAGELGIHTVLYDVGGSELGGRHRVIHNLMALLEG